MITPDYDVEEGVTRYRVWKPSLWTINAGGIPSYDETSVRFDSSAKLNLPISTGANKQLSVVFSAAELEFGSQITFAFVSNNPGDGNFPHNEWMTVPGLYVMFTPKADGTMEKVFDTPSRQHS